LCTAPIILINHALTGNISESGWWNDIVESIKLLILENIQLSFFDVPGNGFNSWYYKIYEYKLMFFIEGLPFLARIDLFALSEVL
jgi:homoserine O-acetyltransferase